jgi:hypothetical protein
MLWLAQIPPRMGAVPGRSKGKNVLGGAPLTAGGKPRGIRDNQGLNAASAAGRRTGRRFKKNFERTGLFKVHS